MVYVVNRNVADVVNPLFILGEELDVIGREGVRCWSIPSRVVNLQIIFLLGLTPFDATKANKTAQIDPVYE